MPLTPHQKAYRFAKTIKKVKTKAEKRERAHIICEYLMALTQSSRVKPRI